MTVIAAVCTTDGVWMGGDSGIDSEFGRKGSGLMTACPLDIVKVRDVELPGGETLLWGSAGLHNIAQRIEFDHEWSHPTDDVKKWLWAEGKRIWAMFFNDERTEREMMADEDEDWPGVLDVSLIVGFRGRIFTFDGSGAVDECSMDFQTVGSGMLPAAGALFSSNNLMLKPEERLREALEAAAHLHTEVQPPFVIKFAPIKE